MSSGARLLSCFRDAVDGFGGHATASATSSTRGDAISRETLHTLVPDALKATSAMEQSESLRYLRSKGCSEMVAGVCVGRGDCLLQGSLRHLTFASRGPALQEPVKLVHTHKADGKSSAGFQRLLPAARPPLHARPVLIAATQA